MMWSNIANGAQSELGVSYFGELPRGRLIFAVKKCINAFFTREGNYKNFLKKAFKT
jgi:hypothetical protein